MILNLESHFYKLTMKGRNTTMSLFDDRKQTKKNPYMNTGRENSGQKKTGIYATSEMQGILATKEANEKKAAGVVSEFLVGLAEKTYDEKLLMKNLDNLLIGFTTEEKLRIVSMALVRALCQIS